MLLIWITIFIFYRPTYNHHAVIISLLRIMSVSIKISFIQIRDNEFANITLSKNNISHIDPPAGRVGTD